MQLENINSTCGDNVIIQEVTFPHLEFYSVVDPNCEIGKDFPR